MSLAENDQRIRPSEVNQPVVVAVTLSGGGARAAAFGLGVLRELKATRFALEGQETTLLDQVFLVSGVSGGQHPCRALRGLRRCHADSFRAGFSACAF